jgi:protein associated with RNAse G/E
VNSITVHKYNHAGEHILQYEGEILESNPTWVCLRAVFKRDEANLGFVTFRQGDVFIEWFYTDRWYNIFQVYDADTQRLKGWYCNITRPAVITGTEVRADDLELDVFVMPNGTVLLLDEKEFSAMNPSVDERIAALRAVEAIRRAVAGREAPFEAVRPDAGV